MDFELSEDQRAIRDTARAFAAERLAPNAAKWDEEAIFPVDVLREAAALGFAGLYVDEDVGGSALTRLDAALVFEELSGGCTSTAAFISIHNMASWMIDKFGGEDLRQKYLPRMTTMEFIASYCLTEPGSGSDAGALATRARLDGHHYVLNGSKAFISGAGVSDIYICMVRTGEGGPGGVSCLVVEKGTPGLSFGKPERKMGWNSQPTGMVIFEDCRVPAENLVGVEGQGFRIAMAGLDGGRINIGACSVGTAQAALREALDYASNRKQFGKAIVEFQASQFKLADMATELEAAELLTLRAAWKCDQGRMTDTDAAMAKLFASEALAHITDEALQIFGGMGLMASLPIERFWRDARVERIWDGTSEIQRHIISRAMLRAHGS